MARWLTCTSTGSSAPCNRPRQQREASPCARQDRLLGQPECSPISQRHCDQRQWRDLAHPPIRNGSWVAPSLFPRILRGRYGPFLTPACFHHGIPLIKGGADVPLGVGGPGSTGGGCVTWTGRGGIGAARFWSLVILRDRSRVFRHDRPVPGRDSVK